MTQTIPLTITSEASAFIADQGLQKTFQELLDNIPKHFSNLHGIAVSLMEPYDLGGGPVVMFDVTRDHPGLVDDPSERQWQHWVVGNYPPEEFEHFVLMTIYK